MIKKCRICGQEFETIPNGGSRQYCFDCAPQGETQQELVSSRRRALKAEGIKELGGKCYHCGYDKTFALEFHHVVSKDKEFVMGDLLSNFKIKEFFYELEKCIPLCSNCHKELHYLENQKQLNYQDFIKPFYSNPVFKQIDRNESKIKYYCKDCGKEIFDSKSERCVSCYGISIRKTERPSAIDLAKDIKELGFKGTGAKYGLSDNGIRRWCDSYNIPRHKKELIDWYDKQIK